MAFAGGGGGTDTGIFFQPWELSRRSSRVTGPIGVGGGAELHAFPPVEVGTGCKERPLARAEQSPQVSFFGDRSSAPNPLDEDCAVFFVYYQSIFNDRTPVLPSSSFAQSTPVTPPAAIGKTPRFH